MDSNQKQIIATNNFSKITRQLGTKKTQIFPTVPHANVWQRLTNIMKYKLSLNCFKQLLDEVFVISGIINII